MGVKPVDRPQIKRSNIVCAEPMPGSPEMLQDFIATLNPPLLGELVKVVFEKMQLAGEAGSLLKIEEEIRSAIDTARSKWLKTLEELPLEMEGDYDWAHLAYTIWPQRVEKVCEKDRSIAIAHDLEHLCKVAPPKPKKKRGKKAAKDENDGGEEADGDLFAED